MKERMSLAKALSLLESVNEERVSLGNHEPMEAYGCLTINISITPTAAKALAGIARAIKESGVMNQMVLDAPNIAGIVVTGYDQNGNIAGPETSTVTVTGNSIGFGLVDESQMEDNTAMFVAENFPFLVEEARKRDAEKLAEAPHA